MLDPKLLRNDLDHVIEQLARRDFALDLKTYQDLESQRHALQLQTQELQTQRNKSAKEIGHRKSQGEDVQSILAEVADLGDELKAKEQTLNEVKAKLLDFELNIPNLPDASVPSGKSENDNILVRQWGEPRQFKFKPLDHISLGEQLGQIDFEAAAKLSGSRFVVLRQGLARMQRALAQFMLDLHITQHGYQELYVPYLVKSEALVGTGQLPKFKDDQFFVAGDWDLVLIPTAEVSLANLVREQILSHEQLPLKFVAQTPCFRSEAGSYGKDVRGMIRQHQFQKVELVQVVHPDRSFQALEEITQQAEKVLQLLELPYRVMQLCTADLGFSAAKTYDLEVWLPGQERYREISSISNCLDFQARRMKARFRNETGKPELVHTLNGSGLAIGRTLIAIIENYQDEQGRIHIPQVLKHYLPGMDIIE